MPERLRYLAHRATRDGRRLSANTVAVQVPTLRHWQKYQLPQSRVHLTFCESGRNSRMRTDVCDANVEVRMRATLLAGSLLVAFAMPAIAQAPGGQQGQQANQGSPGYQNEQENYGPPGMMWEGGGPHGWGEWDEWHGGPGPWAEMHRRFGPEQFQRAFGALGAGTFYRFKRGKDEVVVHCAPREPVQQCVRGAIELMKALPPVEAAPSASQTQH